MILDLFAGPYTCGTCSGEFASEDMFYRNKLHPTGQCRGCRRVARRAWYERNTAKAIAYSVTWKRENRTRWQDANRKSKYGLPYGDYARMLSDQGGCAICGAPESGKSLHVDHDHATGKIRGLLCDLCNRGIGYFSDNPERLEMAADYLRRTS